MRDSFKRVLSPTVSPKAFLPRCLGPLDQARKDSALAGAAAAAVGNPPQVAAALTVVSTQRAAHARALSTEINRAAGKLTSSSNETASPSPAEATVRGLSGGPSPVSWAAAPMRRIHGCGCSIRTISALVLPGGVEAVSSGLSSRLERVPIT